MLNGQKLHTILLQWGEIIQKHIPTNGQHKMVSSKKVSPDASYSPGPFCTSHSNHPKMNIFIVFAYTAVLAVGFASEQRTSKAG